VNPSLDRQDDRPRWPYPLDNPVDRARKVALMYRARLGALNPAARDECDQTAASFGETWMLDRPQLVDPNQELTGDQAAELVRVSESTIRKWATQTQHPEKPGERLLKPFGWDGRRRTYLAGAVLEAAAAMGRAQHERARS
jgi:hypothetical protein